LWRWRSEAVAVLFWAALVAGSLAHNLALIDAQAGEIATARARMLFTVIEAIREWNADHGGVYARVDSGTRPNPYLEPFERDAVLFGRPFTRVNAADMTRQISEMVRARQGVRFHLTSRTPINPDNAPDAWERAALERFTRGGDPIIERTRDQDVPVFRYMAGLRVTPVCLQCHASQGYRPGDIGGGISVTMPEAQILGEVAPQRHQAIVLHAAGFLLLCGATLLLLSRLRHSWTALEHAKAEQERMVGERTAELRASNAELGRSNAELEHFAYMASHDLQEPLRMVGAYAGLVTLRYGSRLDDEGREYLGYMAEGARRMKAMIEDLLAYARVDSSEPAFAAVASDDALDVALAHLAPAIAESGAEIVRPVPLPCLFGEEARLVRLFQNVVGNAIKYRRPDVAPRIVVSVEPDGPWWRFAVADNGIGIPDDARERVFQIFQRLQGHEYPGTGIGLAMCRKIVERHGGRIWVEAGADGGSVFRFTLPGAAP
jgi:signal transduction histidine kinase